MTFTWHPQVSVASPTHHVYPPTLTKLWQGASTAGGSCQLMLELRMSSDAHTHAGAPEKLAVRLNVTGGSSSGGGGGGASAPSIAWDVFQINKRPTRLPEAGFFTVNPAVPELDRWRLKILGSLMDPTDVVGGPNIYGGSPHLHGVESVEWSSAGTRTSSDQ